MASQRVLADPAAMQDPRMDQDGLGCRVRTPSRLSLCVVPATAGPGQAGSGLQAELGIATSQWVHPSGEPDPAIFVAMLSSGETLGAGLCPQPAPGGRLLGLVAGGKGTADSGWGGMEPRWRL